MKQHGACNAGIVTASYSSAIDLCTLEHRQSEVSQELKHSARCLSLLTKRLPHPTGGSGRASRHDRRGSVGRNGPSYGQPFPARQLRSTLGRLCAWQARLEFARPEPSSQDTS